MGEAELEEIVKIGQAGENVRALMNVDGSDGAAASGRLLGDYQGTLEMAKMARTPRTAPQRTCLFNLVNPDKIPELSFLR